MYRWDKGIARSRGYRSGPIGKMVVVGARGRVADSSAMSPQPLIVAPGSRIGKVSSDAECATYRKRVVTTYGLRRPPAR